MGGGRREQIMKVFLVLTGLLACAAALPDKPSPVLRHPRRGRQKLTEKHEEKEVDEDARVECDAAPDANIKPSSKAAHADPVVKVPVVAPVAAHHAPAVAPFTVFNSGARKGERVYASPAHAYQAEPSYRYAMAQEAVGYNAAAQPSYPEPTYLADGHPLYSSPAHAYHAEPSYRHAMAQHGYQAPAPAYHAAPAAPAYHAAVPTYASPAHAYQAEPSYRYVMAHAAQPTYASPAHAYQAEPSYRYAMAQHAAPAYQAAPTHHQATAASSVHKVY